MVWSKADSCENCGRDLPNAERCEYCGHDNHITRITGGSAKRIRREIREDRIRAAADAMHGRDR